MLNIVLLLLGSLVYHQMSYKLLKISSYTAWVGSCTANGTDVFSDATGASKLSTYPKLNAGNLVDIIGESGTRYQVRIAAKYIGYVEKSNIKNPNTPAATTTKKYPFVGKVTASKLNVRKKTGTEHPLLQSIRC